VKIGKSEGNVIGLTDPAGELFGKIMSLGDDAIIQMFILLTDVPMEEIKKFNLKKDAMVLKKRAASLIIAQLHSKVMAQKAEENFISTFQKKEIPEKMEEIKTDGIKNFDGLGAILVFKKVVASMSDWRRLVDEGAIKKLSGKTEEKITDFKITATPGVYKIGKHRFIKIK